MAADSPTQVIPEARPKRGMIRERFENEKDSVIESALGKGESWAKKVGANISGVMLDDIGRLLDALGLRVVDKTKVCVDREVYEAYRALARAAVTDAKKLDWEDEPT